MSNIIEQLNEVKKRFSDDIFLSNKGLSNEVGIHVFCYDPREEMLVSSFFSDLIQSEIQAFHLKECDLYRIFLQICEEKRILKSIPAMEKKKGSDYLLKQLQKAISPEDFVKKMEYEHENEKASLFYKRGIFEDYLKYTGQCIAYASEDGL